MRVSRSTPCGGKVQALRCVGGGAEVGGASRRARPSSSPGRSRGRNRESCYASGPWAPAPFGSDVPTAPSLTAPASKRQTCVRVATQLTVCVPIWHRWAGRMPAQRLEMCVQTRLGWDAETAGRAARLRREGNRAVATDTQPPQNKVPAAGGAGTQQADRAPRKNHWPLLCKGARTCWLAGWHSLAPVRNGKRDAKEERT